MKAKVLPALLLQEIFGFFTNGIGRLNKIEAHELVEVPFDQRLLHGKDTGDFRWRYVFGSRDK